MWKPQLVETILTTTTLQGGGLATLIGLVTLVLGATAVFGELQTTLNLIWEVKPAPSGGIWASLGAWLKQRFLSLAMVFTVAFLLLPQHKSDAMVHSSPESGVSNEIG